MAKSAKRKEFQTASMGAINSSEPRDLWTSAIKGVKSKAPPAQTERIIKASRGVKSSRHMKATTAPTSSPSRLVLTGRAIETLLPSAARTCLCERVYKIIIRHMTAICTIDSAAAIGRLKMLTA